jgi:hypothetical protein
MKLMKVMRNLQSVMNKEFEHGEQSTLISFSFSETRHGRFG